MTDTADLINCLKKELKAHGLTYVDVARELELSEASVKRLFSINHFTLERLSKICSLIGFEFADLVRIADESRQRISHLSLEQEKELVRNPQLLLVAMLARNHFSFDQIIETYDIDDKECFRLLAQLERIKLIEIHPFNRIKLRVAEDFRWLPNGPIEKMFEMKFLREFLADPFSKEGDTRIYLHGMLSKSSRDQINQRLHALIEEFSSRLKQDARRDLTEKERVGMFLAFRAWEPELFANLRSSR